jgi:hypothetical protein
LMTKTVRVFKDFPGGSWELQAECSNVLDLQRTTDNPVSPCDGSESASKKER